MAKKIGIGCIVLGICCILGSVGFVIYNHFEETYAENASKSMLQNVQEKITESAEETFDETFSDTLSFLITKAEKFDTGRNKKAYSYYGNICKNYL